MITFKQFYKDTKGLTEFNDSVVNLGNGYKYVLSLKPLHMDTNSNSLLYYSLEQLPAFYGTTLDSIVEMFKAGTLPRNLQGSLIREATVIEIGFVMDDTGNDLDPEEMDYRIRDDIEYFKNKYC